MVKESVVSPVLLLVVLGYVFIGAFVLRAFEQPTELANCELANGAIQNIIDKSARLRVQLPDDVRSDTSKILFSHLLPFLPEKKILD